LSGVKTKFYQATSDKMFAPAPPPSFTYGEEDLRVLKILENCQQSIEAKEKAFFS